MGAAYASALIATCGSIVAGCGAPEHAPRARVPIAAEVPETRAESCLVDGAPLASITPLVGACSPRSTASEDLANGLRLYQQERYAEAVACFERELRVDREPDDVGWQRRARWYLARSYAHLGRTREWEALLLEIVRTPDDPFRWTAAGWTCGEHRPTPQLDECEETRFVAPMELGDPPEPLAYDEPHEMPSRTEEARALQWVTRVLRRCAQIHRAGLVQVELVWRSDGSTGDVRLTGDTGVRAPDGTSMSSCVARDVRRLRIAPFTGASWTTVAQWRR